MISKARSNMVVKPSTQSSFKESPLMTAVRANQTDKVAQLLKAGENPNSKDAEGLTCLMHATKKQNVEIVKLLIDAGAKNAKHTASALQRKYDFGGWTALMYAAENGNFEIANMILAADEDEFQKGGDRNINVADYKGQTALSIAIENGRLRIAELLIKAFANPLIVDDDSNTALDLAIDRNFRKLVALTRGFIRPIDDDVKLFQAIQRDEVEIAELLLKNNANPNVRDKNWETPLIHAVKNKRADLDLIRLLLRAGANPNTKDNAGKPLLLTASLRNDFALVELLIQYGAKNE